jgi:hypothetical protein
MRIVCLITLTLARDGLVRACGAGDGNRTRMVSLEAQYSSCSLTCELRDQQGTNLARGVAGVAGASPGGQHLRDTTLVSRE